MSRHDSTDTAARVPHAAAFGLEASVTLDPGTGGGFVPSADLDAGLLAGFRGLDGRLLWVAIKSGFAYQMVIVRLLLLIRNSESRTIARHKTKRLQGGNMEQFACVDGGRLWDHGLSRTLKKCHGSKLSKVFFEFFA